MSAGNPNIVQVGKATQITAANSRMLAAKSAEARRRKAMLAASNRTVARLAASDPTIQTPYDAWGELVADQAEALRQAASEGKPRGDDLHRVGQAMGMIPLASDKQAGVQTDNQPQADAVIMLLVSRIGGQVVDADAVDAETDTETGGGRRGE